MSTFKGNIKEIPGISVDRFDGDNWRSRTYFLSHCHTDHMVGLDEGFFRSLEKYDKTIYTSPISKVCLARIYPRFTGCIQELLLEHPTSITVAGTSILITCIPAGHCPGSVMFLFETRECRVLYTGDYRIGESDLKKFTCFYDVSGNIKAVDKVYLDTTFFFKTYRSFPPRTRSLEEICLVIDEWISKGVDKVVKLHVCARIGYEYLFKGIYERFNMPVHVDVINYNLYRRIPELDRCVSMDGGQTQIHCCSLNNGRMCTKTLDSNLRVIKISAYRWENANFNKEGLKKCENGIYYVCYSTHASYEEGCALIDFLKPKDVHINVERQDENENVELFKTVQEALRKNSVKRVKRTEEVKLFKIPRKTSMEASPSKSHGGSTWDSPPR